MFDNPILDFFSRVHFSVPLFIFIPVIGFFLYHSFFIFQLAWYFVLAWFIGGVLFWTLTEYVMHRFVFHFQPNSELGKKIHFITHGVHHDYPNDSWRLVMPPILSIPLSSMFYGLFVLVIGNATIIAPFFAGFISGYLVYDMMHYALHHVQWKNKWFQQLKKHHMVHHFHDPDNGFGVSSALWDNILGTKFNLKKD